MRYDLAIEAGKDASAATAVPQWEAASKHLGTDGNDPQVRYWRSSPQSPPNAPARLLEPRVVRMG